MATPIRMKKKDVTRIHLDTSGNMAMKPTPVSSDAASKGASAQPAGPMTAQETTGLPGGKSIHETPTQSEEGTGKVLQPTGPEQQVQATSQGATSMEDAIEEMTEETPEEELANG